MAGYSAVYINTRANLQLFVREKFAAWNIRIRVLVYVQLICLRGRWTFTFYTTCFVLYTILNASIRFLIVNHSKPFFKTLILLKKKTTTTKLNKRPRPHVPEYFWKLNHFFCFQNPHGEYSNRFYPFPRKRKNDANSINISISPELTVTTIQCFQNSHSGTIFKNLCFWCPKTDQNSVYVWTEGLKGLSHLWDRADLDTTFASLKSVYLNPKSNVRVGYI